MSITYEIAKLTAKYDAKIKVEVPAKQGRKAYSYMREGGEGEEKKPSGNGKKIAIAATVGGLGLAAALGTAAIIANNKNKPPTTDPDSKWEANKKERAKKEEAQEDLIIKNTGLSKQESQDILRSIQYFTANEGYKPIRKAEKEGNPYIVRSKDGQRDIDSVEAINKFIDLSPKHEGTIYRGVLLKDSALKPFLDNIQGDGLVLNAMSSFSADVNVANTFARADFDPRDAPGKSVVIISKNNKSGVDISALSYTLMDEKEVLVPAGSFYKATKVEVKKGEEGRDVYYVYADEIDPVNQKIRRDKYEQSRQQ